MLRNKCLSKNKSTKMHQTDNRLRFPKITNLVLEIKNQSKYLGRNKIFLYIF